MADKEWACRVNPDTLVRLSELSWQAAIDVGPGFGRLYSAPLANPADSMRGYEACCRHAGVEVRALTVGEMWDVWELVDENRPTMFRNGIPDPKAVASPETTSLS